MAFIFHVFRSASEMTYIVSGAWGVKLYLRF